jgi:CheY-like chemotaxis protein
VENLHGIIVARCGINDIGLLLAQFFIVLKAGKNYLIFDDIKIVITVLRIEKPGKELLSVNKLQKTGIMKKSHPSKPTIYLADDDPDDRELLTEAFQKLTDNHHIKTVINGKELIESLSVMDDSELPCVIVLDYNMPGLDGKQVLAFLQNSERYQHIPKIIYSTSNSLKDKKEFLAIGASEYLTKATSSKDILHAARKILSYCDTDIMKSA